MAKHRVLPAAAIAIAAVMVVVACAPEVVAPPASTVTLEPRENRGAVPSPPPDPKPAVAWPLSGADAAGLTGEELNRPAIAIKIENSADARPQSNLYRADIVYEEYVEYGISRLVAVYHSDLPETVGPIRSMRPMDKNIAGQYVGPLVFSGAQGRFITDARNSGQKLIAQDIGSYGFFRVNTKRAPHNLHGTLADFLAQSEGLTAPPPPWEYAYPSEFATAQMEGSPVALVDIFMSGRAQPKWHWDAAQGLWMRFENADAHVDANGTQISASNIVVLWVDVKYTSRQGGSSVPETIMITDGNPGYVVSGDRMIEVIWSKSSRTAVIEIVTLDGDPVVLLPGQTWVELVPRSGVGHKTSVDFE
ncbi:MAG: DUF3048 domain-containing protein [Actinobacteria bacterium HGW-Actinobacteria-4]|nr:MAG: DUF3048 domain-containing protein [Actinobacteria bacterium HGW-Actinobacteria-4]